MSSYLRSAFCSVYIDLLLLIILHLPNSERQIVLTRYNLLRRGRLFFFAIHGMKEACTFVNHILDSLSSFHRNCRRLRLPPPPPDFRRADVVTQNMVIVRRRLMSSINPCGARHSSSYLSWLSRVYRRQNAAALVNDVKYGRP